MSRFFLIALIILFNISCQQTTEGVCDIEMENDLPRELEYKSLDFMAVYSENAWSVEKYILIRETSPTEQFFLIAITNERGIKILVDKEYGINVWDTLKGINYNEFTNILNATRNDIGHKSCGGIEVSTHESPPKNHRLWIERVFHPTFLSESDTYKEPRVYDFIDKDKDENLKDIYYYLGAKLTRYVGFIGRDDYSKNQSLGEVLYFKEFSKDEVLDLPHKENRN